MRTRCPPAQPGQVDKGVIRGDVDRERRRGLLHAQSGGLGEDAVLADHRAIGDAPAVDEDHLVAGLQPLHRHAGAAHHAARFHADLPAERGTLIGQGRQQPQRHHDIAEVERCGRDVDLHVVRPQGRRVAGLHPQAADLSRVVQEQPIGRVFAGGDTRVLIAIAHDARHPQPSLAHGQLAFAQVVAREPRQGIEIVGGAQIH